VTAITVEHLFGAQGVAVDEARAFCCTERSALIVIGTEKRVDIFATGGGTDTLPRITIQCGGRYSTITLRDFDGWQFFASEAEDCEVRVALWRRP
jgi:hypothetical protein